jgi:hypothetical protein
MAENPLTDLQVEVLQVFFSLPESEGFMLAGGAGLVAVGLSERRTEDLDLFTTRVSVELAADALEAAMLDPDCPSRSALGTSVDRADNMIGVAAESYDLWSDPNSVGGDLVVELSRDVLRSAALADVD